MTVRTRAEAVFTQAVLRLPCINETSTAMTASEPDWISACIKTSTTA